jgi:hypothetical protein
MAHEPERWRLEHAGESHVVEVAQGFRRGIVWSVDGEEVARKRTTDDRTTIGADGRDDKIALKISGWSDSARRVALYPASRKGVPVPAAAAIGAGGIDFVPDPGTKAAKRQAQMLAHPKLFFLRRTGAALAVVLLAIGASWIGRQLLELLPDVDLPDVNLPRVLPEIDLPDIPWPSINLPDLPDLPEWVAAISPFVIPVVIAAIIARGELKRRRAQLERRQAEAHEPARRAPSTDRVGAEDAAERDPR